MSSVATGGRAFVDRFGRYVLLSHADLDRAEAWFERRGDGPWPSAGSSPSSAPSSPSRPAWPRCPRSASVCSPSAGSLVWIGALAGAGDALGNRWNKLTHGFTLPATLIAAVVVLAIAAFLSIAGARLRRPERTAAVAPAASPPPRAGRRP